MFFLLSITNLVYLITETLKFWFDSVHFYGSTYNYKNEDSEQVIRPTLRSITENGNALTADTLTQIIDHHDVPGNEGKNTFQNDLNPPIIAIGTHKDQCKVWYIFSEIKEIIHKKKSKSR